METDWNQRYIDESTPWDSGEPSKELTRALDQKLIEPCRVLELGCGTGTNAIFLARAGFSVTAVDLSEEALRQARSKAEAAGVDIEFIQADVTALPDLGEPSPSFLIGAPIMWLERSILLGLLKRYRKWWHQAASIWS